MAGAKDKREITDLLSDVIKQITSKVEIDEAILFGSYAKGTANEDSDIDLVITSAELTGKSILSNTRNIKQKTKLLVPGLQLFAFNNETFNNETFVDPGFIQEIKRTGKKIYSKAAGFLL